MAGQFYFAKTLQEASGLFFIVLFMMVNSLVMMALFIMPQMILLMLAIRRAHDLGKSGEIVAFYMGFPFMAFMLPLCFAPKRERKGRTAMDRIPLPKRACIREKTALDPF